MTSQLLKHTGFEAGVVPVEYEDSTPVAVTAATDQTYSGTYSIKAELASNDQYETALSAGQFDRATALTPVSAGIAFRIEDVASMQAIVPIMLASESTNQDQSTAVFVDDAGVVSVRGIASLGGASQASGTVVWSSGVPIVRSGEWYYFELEVVADASAGTVELHINGIQMCALTGLDTNFTSFTPIKTGWGTGFYFDTDNGVSSAVWIDDLYCGEDIGILGPQKHEMLSPTSSVESDGTGSDADQIDNHLLVDEVPFDGADYVDLDVATDRETYGFADRTHTGQVNAISVLAQVHDPDVGSVTSNAYLISNAVEADGDGIVLTGTAGDRIVGGPFETDPDTGIAFTTSDVNALTGGLEVSAIA